MKKKLRRLVRSNQFTASIAACFLLRKTNSYLNSAGWFDGFQKSIPVDKQGIPLPWYTYGAIEFLKGRINSEMTVFEYGSGNSTLWWAKHVNKVISCEHHEQWYNKMKSQAPSNVEYTLVELVPGGDYSKEICQYKQVFDIIIIDGRDRINCSLNSLEALKDCGVIIWDNSDRDRYQPGYDFLTENGFKRLDFSGMGPINTAGWTTSIFYRPDNCLGL